MLANQKITFIGGGHIAEIIIHNLIQEGAIPPQNIIVSDPGQVQRRRLEERFGVTLAPDNVAAAQAGDMIMICVRPQVVKVILPDLQAADLRPDQVVISIAAGISLAAYRPLGAQQPVARALPNPPSQIGQGIAPLVFSPAVTPEQRVMVLALFSSLGDWVEVDESNINAITSLSSPVATYMFFKSLIEAGVDCGLPHSIAEKVAAQTIIGSMAVWGERQTPPGELIEEASTPGGVSVESVRRLEEGGFKAAVVDAIVRGAARAKEMGEN